MSSDQPLPSVEPKGAIVQQPINPELAFELALRCGRAEATLDQIKWAVAFKEDMESIRVIITRAGYVA